MSDITESEVKLLFSLRPEIEMEKQMRLAHYHKREEIMPPHEQKRIEDLERQLLKIDALMAVLTRDEAFVVQKHLIEGIDWARIIKEYNDVWGTDMEKSIRSLQICLTKALKKITATLNHRIDFDWHEFE